MSQLTSGRASVTEGWRLGSISKGGDWCRPDFPSVPRKHSATRVLILSCACSLDSQTCRLPWHTLSAEQDTYMLVTGSVQASECLCPRYRAGSWTRMYSIHPMWWVIFQALLSLNNHIEMNLDYILSYVIKEGTGERHKIAEFPFSLFLLFLSTKIISVLTLLFKMLVTPFLYFYRASCSVWS